MLKGMSLVQSLQMFAPSIVIQLLLMIFCLVKLTKDNVRYLPKWAWALIIIFGELLGPIIYLFVGREKE